MNKKNDMGMMNLPGTRPYNLIITKMFIDLIKINNLKVSINTKQLSKT